MMIRRTRWTGWIRWAGLVLATLVLGGAFDADAQSKRARRPAKKPAKQEVVASEQTTVEIGRLLQPFKWGMSSQQVLASIEKDLRTSYDKRLKAASSEPLQYDRVRREMMAAHKRLKESLIQFTGKQVSWDVSMVDKEFAHKNNEAMLVRWGSEDRRFFFFHHDRLWKVFIAFSTERFAGKTFADFSEAMEARFGRADRKYRATIKGDAQMAYLHWPPSKTTILRALDNTKLYGNFCLILIDRSALPQVIEARKVNAPSKQTRDGLIDAVTKDSGDVSDANEDVVDRITGRAAGGTPIRADTEVPAARRSSGTSSGSSDSSSGAADAPKRKRKVDPKNPLDGLDL